MIQIAHPDELLTQQAIRNITRGGRQAADSAAMEAYYDSINAGKTIDEAGEIFIKMYQKLIHGK